MHTKSFALALTGFCFFVAIQPSAAEVTYPWCAQYGTNNGGRNCGFSTYAQCLATISGNGGYCETNPLYTPDATQAVRRSRR